LTYVGERPDAGEAMDQLEAILRDVAEELASWRARAQKAESELKQRGGAGSGERGTAAAKADPALESENKALRVRVEAARTRVHDLLQRLTFLEEQAREAASGNGGARAATGS
jgi:chromosome segregation ATPase